ncbi:hypothetical protein J2129_000765 [Methanofollis sp. W23]|nr:hypothetical protein [Methanofollis sp. W23]
MDVYATKRGEFDTIIFLYLWQRGNSGKFWDDLPVNVSVISGFIRVQADTL